MRATPTLAGIPPVHSCDSMHVAIRAFTVELRETHGLAPGGDGYCAARYLADQWHGLTGEPMPVSAMRHELKHYLHGDDYDYRDRFVVQRDADRSLAEALLNGDVRLVRLPRRARR